jgi:hypothetical protein
MYWRSVVLPMTDFEDIVTLVVDLPGVSAVGTVLPQPELAANATGQSTPKTRERERIAAMIECNEQVGSKHLQVLSRLEVI